MCGCVHVCVVCLHVCVVCNVCDVERHVCGVRVHVCCVLGACVCLDSMFLILYELLFYTLAILLLFLHVLPHESS